MRELRKRQTGFATRNNRDSSADAIPHSKSHKQDLVREITAG
jgi:hypothetical protein